jgi:uncharacterized membrane protein
METKMNALWIATLGASLACYLLKLAGFLIPETLLKRPRLQRINELIPVVLLSALVAVQTVSDESKLVIDHRIAGVAVAAVALKMKVSFPIMMMLAAITSAIIYRI